MRKTWFMLCVLTILVVSALSARASETPAKNSDKQEKIKTITISAKDDIKIEVGIKSKSAILSRILVEPAGEETEKADRNLPGWFCIPRGLKAYKIMAQDPSGNLLEKDKIKGAFALGLGYPGNIRPELERNLRLFVLHEDRWIPVKSRLNLASRMIKTESAKQFGTYRLLAPAAIDQQNDIIAYPNPVQFGFGKELKFRNVPVGSVIEIYTISGEQIREIDILKSADAIWDGKKDNDELVTSGLYLYRVQLVGDEAFGKIVVMR